LSIEYTEIDQSTTYITLPFTTLPALDRGSTRNPTEPNIAEIEAMGRMHWQKEREYGRRNYSELGVQRYQRAFGDTMHAREFSRQEQEAMIASGALN